MITGELDMIGGRRRNKNKNKNNNDIINPKRKKPNKCNELLLDEKIWRFTKQIPKSLKTLPEKIWFIKKNIRHKISINNPIGDEINESDLPSGFSLWHPPSKESIPAARKEIISLFKREEKLGKNAKLPFVSYPERGLRYIFSNNTNEEKRAYSYREVMPMLRKESPILADYCEKYYRYLSMIYNLKNDELADSGMLALLRYKPNSGIWLHIDNVARYDRGPIMTSSLGPKTVTYDLTPTLLKDKKAVRIEFDEGDVAIMDGASRMNWAHALPYDIDSYKYTIMFKCDHFSSKKVDYQELLDTDIFESKQLDQK